MAKRLFEFFDKTAPLQDAKHVGGKAYHLISMLRNGLPVPEGFVIDTSFTFEDPIEPNDDIMHRVRGTIREAADRASRDWGSDARDPYLVSVRSGAPVSMPGMMDTILNVGLNDEKMEAISEGYGKIFALDCYRRLIHTFGVTVGGVDPAKFAEVYKAAEEFYLKMDAEAMQTVVDKYLKIYPITQNIDEQLHQAIRAVYASWDSPRAIEYRKFKDIDPNLGTACVIQGMRFGNLNVKSGTGVACSRHPTTGKVGGYGSFVRGGQGPDVVDGTHNSLNLSDMQKLPDFKQAADHLSRHLIYLENHLVDMVDVEFTVEDGNLWILQVRKAHGSTQAGVVMLLDQFEKQKMTRSRLESELIDLLDRATPPPAQSVKDEKAKLLPFGTGIGVVDGEITGKLAMSLTDIKDDGEPYIFVAEATTPSDIDIMLKASGIVTRTGSKVCHAAMVAREIGIPTIVGCETLEFHDAHGSTISVGDVAVSPGDLLCMTVKGDLGSLHVVR